MNALLATDGYKVGHHQQYPEGTTLVYSNFTPRSNKYAPKGCDKIVSFGQQMVIKQIHELFQNEFFSKPKDEVCGEMKRELSLYLGTDYDVSHFEKLHDLGFLPIHVKSIEEGSLVPMKVPVLTIYNTIPEFYWVTNYLETIISNLLWKPMTSATIAHAYRKVLTKWQEKTDKEKAWFIDWQGHDFSMRGLDSIDATISSGLGHLTSFTGTDSLPAIYGARKYYGETGFVGGSVNATEHSVMCAGGKDDEIGTFKRLLETYPKGILAIVSDTWSLWDVCTKHLVTLKEDILSRDGKLVIRPDSGNPVDILCGENIESFDNLEDAKAVFNDDLYNNQVHGDRHYEIPETRLVRVGDKFYQLNADTDWNRYDKQYYFIESIDIQATPIDVEPKHKGVIELLWDVFGGTINEQGYKVLDPHIGAIYGDSITIGIADEICERLEKKGFASTNVTLGLGSFNYQYNTRDTFGFAMKATYVELEVPMYGELSDQNLNTKIIGREIFKDPVTDDGTKKSATGLLCVTYDNENGYMLADKVTWDGEANGVLRTIYKEGSMSNQTTLTEIRNKLKINLVL
jgi:nicotinamide phosphoribosyltransferase